MLRKCLWFHKEVKIVLVKSIICTIQSLHLTNVTNYHQVYIIYHISSFASLLCFVLTKQNKINMKFDFRLSDSGFFQNKEIIHFVSRV